MSKLLSLKEWLTFEEIVRLAFSILKEPIESKDLLSVILEHGVPMRFISTGPFAYYDEYSDNFNYPYALKDDDDDLVFNGKKSFPSGDLISFPKTELYDIRPIENIFNIHEPVCFFHKNQKSFYPIYRIDTARLKSDNEATYLLVKWSDICNTRTDNSFIIFNKTQVRHLLIGIETENLLDKVLTPDKVDNLSIKVNKSDADLPDCIENPMERKTVAKIIGKLILKAFPLLTKDKGLHTHALYETVVKETGVTQTTAKKWVDAAADALKK